jgi:hypothetical protein
MRAPSERDQRQAKLDILVKSFMRDDIPAFRDACEWLRDFADHTKRGRGLVHRGRYWYAPQDGAH